MNPLEWIHEGYVFGRRIRTLCGHLAELIPSHARVLDVGCGDGALAHRIAQQRPDLTLEGIDTLVRMRTPIRVKAFDGHTIPYGNASFDVVMFVDTLHHTEDPTALLREAIRVAQQGIVIKDHTREGMLAGPTLRLMDWVGNARHGVALPYRYWPKQRWLDTFQRLGLNVVAWRTNLHLYPWPSGWVFNRSLHFLARLDCPRTG